MGVDSQREVSINNLTILQQHPLCAAFPSMSEEEMKTLIEDIRLHGQKSPIVVLDDCVLDGWHRYQACLALNKEPITANLPEEMDPVAYVLSANLHRRHLTGSQRAAAVVACNKWAKPGNQPKGEVTSPFTTTAELAQIADVSERTIEKAKTAHTAGLGDAMRDGKLSADRAAEIAKLPEKERKTAMEAPKLRIFKESRSREPRPKEPKATSELPESIATLKAIIADRESEIHELSEALDKALEESKAWKERFRKMELDTAILRGKEHFSPVDNILDVQECVQAAVVPRT